MKWSERCKNMAKHLAGEKIKNIFIATRESAGDLTSANKRIEHHIIGLNSCMVCHYERKPSVHACVPNKVPLFHTV